MNEKKSFVGEIRKQVARFAKSYEECKVKTVENVCKELQRGKSASVKSACAALCERVQSLESSLLKMAYEAVIEEYKSLLKKSKQGITGEELLQCVENVMRSHAVKARQKQLCERNHLLYVDRK